jgi:peptide/nickel transport system permease protein
MRGAASFLVRLDGGILLGGFVLLLIVALIGIAPLALPFDGETMSVDAIMTAPSWAHPAGTDHLGRDVLARTLLGGQSTLLLAVLSTVTGVAIGALVGMVAGYKRGVIDDLLMRAGDAVMALPSLVLAMLVLIAVGSGPAAVLLAITIIFAPRAARITRSVVLSVASQDFVAAAAVVGESQAVILFREILPNIWPNILVEGCLRFSYAILLISSLGYLGIGVQPPTPDWGLMISEASAYITTAPWMMMAPAIGIVLSVVCVNLLGDGLQDLMSRSQRRGASHV